MLFYVHCGAMHCGFAMCGALLINYFAYSIYELLKLNNTVSDNKSKRHRLAKNLQTFAKPDAVDGMVKMILKACW